MKPQNKLIAQALKAIVDRKPIAPVLETVLFTSGYIIATDLEHWLTVPFSVYPSLTEPFLVDAGSLSAILKMQDRITISAPDVEGKAQREAHITCPGSVLYKLAAQKQDDFPQQPNRPYSQPKLASITPHNLQDIVMAYDFTSSDKPRPNLQCVLLSEDHIAATDANILAYLPGIKGLKEQILITGRTIRLLNLFKGTWSIQTDGAYVCFTNGDGVEVYQKVAEEKFPDYRAVIPQYDDGVVVRFHRDDMLHAMEKIAPMLDRQTKQIRMDVHHDRVMLSGKDYSYDTSANINLPEHEARPFGEFTLPFAIGFNLRLLTRILKHIPAHETVSMTMAFNNRAVTVNDRFLIMPMMLSEY